ncbi:MAG: hypothetical protein NTY19_01235 [Planctomycetota bacterium]|nr:hypothetical protein [Planctomycetota bacterium]
MWARISLKTLGLAMTLASGCSDNHPVCLPVAGRVTMDGQPLTTGRMGFWPDQGLPAYAPIQSDGSYRLTTFKAGDGAMPGMYVVTVEATQVESAGPQFQSAEQEFQYRAGAGVSQPAKPTVRRLVPVRYSRRETTALRAEAKTGQKNQFDFRLASS